MTTPILAQLRDAAEQRGWVRGLTFDTIVERSGRTPEDVARALRAFREEGLIKFTETHVGDPATITALRITKEARAHTTADAAIREINVIGPEPDDDDDQMDIVTTPLAEHAKRRKPKGGTIEPGVTVFVSHAERADLADMLAARIPARGAEDDIGFDDEHEAIEAVATASRAYTLSDYPAIRELIARESEVVEAAATFERHGLSDLAEEAMERIKTQTPLERDILSLCRALGVTDGLTG